MWCGTKLCLPSACVDPLQAQVLARGDAELPDLRPRLDGAIDNGALFDHGDEFVEKSGNASSNELRSVLETRSLFWRIIILSSFGLFNTNYKTKRYFRWYLVNMVNTF